MEPTYDYYRVKDGKRSILKTTDRSEAIKKAVRMMARAPGRSIYVSAYGAERTCVWCEGQGDNELDEDAIFPMICDACQGTGRATHVLRIPYQTLRDMAIENHADDYQREIFQWF